MLVSNFEDVLLNAEQVVNSEFLDSLKPSGPADLVIILYRFLAMSDPFRIVMSFYHVI